MGEGHRQRLIKKALDHGVDVLYDHEILEIYLYAIYKRVDTNPIAHALLDTFGSLQNVCAAPVSELIKVKGVGVNAAQHIKLLPLLAKGYNISLYRKKTKYANLTEVHSYCREILCGMVTEIIYALYFDNANRLLKVVQVFAGMSDAVELNPRKLLGALEGTAATKVVVCHNHPSGVLAPSQNDFVATKRITNLLASVHVKLWDHVVVADGRFVSCMFYG